MIDCSASIQTFTGRCFYVLDPRSEDVAIDDIAHALSMICRFTGHVKQFYSVAQHSVYASYVCEPQDALWALLHDASEAYVSDMSRPLKHSGAMDAYQEIEKRVMLAVTNHFCLAPEEPESVKVADRRMLLTEMRDLMHGSHGSLPGEPLAGTVSPWSPTMAEARFLRRFRELTTVVKRG